MAIGCAVSIQQGGSFSEYMMRAVVAAGAQIALRGPHAPGFALDDSPVAAELAAARLELALLDAMPEQRAQAACDAEYETAYSQWEARRASRIGLRAKYERVLEQLRNWTPPGPMFEQFKLDRIKEVEASIAGDCSSDRDPPPVRLTAVQWRIQKISDKERVIEHLETTAIRYRFVQALKTSLGISDTPA